MIALGTLAFTFLVFGTVGILVPVILVNSGLPQLSLSLGSLRILGIPTFAFGIALYIWCAWGFTFNGKGTPAPVAPPQRLVVRGPYRYVRNPMYIAVMLLLIGEVVLLESGLIALFAVALFLAFNAFVLGYEEPTLRKKFGSEYDEYRRDVPQWIPRNRQAT